MSLPTSRQTELPQTRPSIPLPVKVHAEVPRDLWHRLHDDDAQAMPTQAPAWVDCLTATGRYRDASRLYEVGDGRLAVLPMVRSLLPGRGAVLDSMPANWGYGGLIAPDGVDAQLLSAVLDDLTALPALRVHVRPNPVQGAMWDAALAGRKHITSVRRTSHVIDLDAGYERLWSEGYKSSTRRAIRRAEKLGVRVETDTTGRLIPVFYELLLRSIDRWADQQHEPQWLAQRRGRRRDPLDKFRTMAEELGERCQVSVAWVGDQPAATAIVLRGGRNAHDTRGAMDKVIAAPNKANTLLQNAVIEAACHDGCSQYHLGESGDSTSLAAFKAGFGARAHHYPEFWIERIPLRRTNDALRSGVKRVIGFRDV